MADAPAVDAAVSSKAHAADLSLVHTGRCLCNAVSYSAKNLSDIWYCHCTQCQKLTGLYIAAAGAKREDISIAGPVNWLPISDKSKSGHCAHCGSYLFWDSVDFDTLSVLAGGLDDASGLVVKGHIYVSQKAQYYEITDGLPQYEANQPAGTRTTEEHR